MVGCMFVGLDRTYRRPASCQRAHLAVEWLPVSFSNIGSLASQEHSATTFPQHCTIFIIILPHLLAGWSTLRAAEAAPPLKNATNDGGT